MAVVCASTATNSTATDLSLAQIGGTPYARNDELVIMGTVVEQTPVTHPVDPPKKKKGFWARVAEIIFKSFMGYAEVFSFCPGRVLYISSF